MTETEFIIYHNPRCSKSRQALALLEEKGISPTIVQYLDDPLDAQQIRQLLDKLGLPPRQLLRSKEDLAGNLGLTRAAVDDETIIDAMAAHPVLIERPVVVRGQRAVIGRPSENVLELID